MPSHQATNAPVEALHHYLESAFPNRVRHIGWEVDVQEPVFEVVHEQARHQVVISAAFLALCPDGADRLRHSELADYMGEAQSQNRRFLLLWQDGALRVRSTPL